MALQKQAIKGGGTWQLLPPCSVLGQFFHYTEKPVSQETLLLLRTKLLDSPNFNTLELGFISSSLVSLHQYPG